MALLGTAALELHLERILGYVQPHMSFVNCHMVGYLTDNLWRDLIPDAIQKEVQSVKDVEKAISLFWDFHKHPQTIDSDETQPFEGFLRFLHTSRAHRLDSTAGIISTVEQLNSHLQSLGFEVDTGSGLQIKEFMSEKKNHEVEVVAQVISTLCGSQTSDEQRKHCVIDAGDGKGYLSSRLALEHHLHVLGIDANEVNTAGAQKRTAQLERAWTGLTMRAEDVRNGLTPPKKGRRRRQQPQQKSNDPQIPANTNYQRSTHFITAQTDFIHLFELHFPNFSPSGFCLSGLHTCGNLASSCMEIFQNNNDIQSLCNVGCCYHLLDEEFAQNDFFVERHGLLDRPISQFGFPLSGFLRSKRFALGRNARMLAAQSLDRTCDTAEVPKESLFYRSLLETLIVEHNAGLKNCVQVGRMKNIGSFVAYVGNCEKRTNLRLQKSEEDLEQLLGEHEFERRRMDLFYLIRMTFAPLLESVILLDRVLYLKEHGVRDVSLVKLFDPVVSPRCYAVVATKT